MNSLGVRLTYSLCLQEYKKTEMLKNNKQMIEKVLRCIENSYNSLKFFFRSIQLLER